MGIGDIIARSDKSAEAGRRERLVSPESIESSRAVRHAARQRWAKTKEAATANDHITCDLLDSDGDPMEEIEVYCYLINTTALNTASPRLLSDVPMPVTYSFGQWRCIWPFEGDEECVCTPPS